MSRVIPDNARQLAALHGGNISPTLLELLGYDLTNCDDHPFLMTVVGHTKYRPDYVLGSDQKVFAIIDLKAPGISLDDKDAVGQIYSYCTRGGKTSPLGVLFNGKSIRVFINPDYQGFGKYKKRSHDPNLAKQINFYETPIDSADNDTGGFASVC